MVLKAANPNTRYCYKKALAARERAFEAKHPQDRLFYFEAEARLLKLAESYEFSARANFSGASVMSSVCGCYAARGSSGSPRRS